MRCKLRGRNGGWRLAVVAVATSLPATPRCAAEAEPAADAIEFFEKEVRPLLADRCQACHGAKKQWAGLRLDSRAAALKGGEGGPSLAPGKPDESELIRRVTEADESLRMPPKEAGERLTPAQVRSLARWVELGAPWPQAPAVAEDSRRAHWAFRPLTRAEPPAVAQEAWVRTPVDRFVLRRLEAEGLSPSPTADRRTLIRRATYDLTGLPPTPEEVEAFLRDDAPDAYPRLIDRLLDSPRYGEQWGRHWLDVARYSDTKGYVYAREEKTFVHAAAYRDWIVRAFNDDLPYDRFLLLQLAADQAAPEDPAALAAMGFLTLGRRFLGVMPDIIDDRIDVVTRGTMGLTVACARCHDHKYDPIPTADYYSLYGVFLSSPERLVPLSRAAGAPSATPEFEAELEARKRKLAEATAASRAEAGARVRQRLADYLHAQRELEKYPEQGFDQILTKDDLIPAIVRRWQAYLAAAADRADPVWIPWLAFASVPDGEFPSRAAEVTASLRESAGAPVNPRIAAAFAEPPSTSREVAERYARVFAEVDRAWQESCEAAKRENRPPPESLPDPDDEALRRVLYEPGSPCVIPDEPIVNTEVLYDSGTVDQLWKLQNEVDRWILQSPASAPHAVILADAPVPVEPRIFRRGNPANKGDAVPRRFLEVIAGKDRQPFLHGSGRLEMASAIVSPDNPLTARVWVNRVWARHFGAGLVRTPSDFGLRSDPPSHPELLDWLAADFIARGWSTKSLHRTIMLSSAYQQASSAELEARNAELNSSVPSSEFRVPSSVDPDNRLLWRMNPRRLGFEELRDTLLAVSGELDDATGGKAVELFPAGGTALRRSIYGLVDRQFVPSVLRVFDFANPDLHSPQRSETTVPQQALFALNHPFVAARARALATRTESASTGGAAARIAALYQAAFQRPPAAGETAAALAFVEAAQADSAREEVPAAVATWSYGHGDLDEAAGRLKTFQPLPHFTGSAWQGGPQFPDPALGWVQLTADGGHPGNDLQRAAVRRWTAPRAGTVSIASTAIHEVAAGDGIRCWVISNRHGVLKSTTLHNTRQPLDVQAVEVQPGDTLDFIVDIRANLNSDQFLWSPEIRDTVAAGDDGTATTRWSAREHFAGPRPALLGPWEQLAQVLLVSNELLFVD